MEKDFTTLNTYANVSLHHSNAFIFYYPFFPKCLFVIMKLPNIFHTTITPFDIVTEFRKGKGFYYKGQEFIHHSDLTFKESAVHRFTPLQLAVISVDSELLLSGFVINWHTTLVVLIAILTTMYFLDLLFNFFLIYKSFRNSPEIKVTNQEIKRISDKKWPLYTIFCPLYKEAHMLPQFINAMKKLDYPSNKLEVMLLLEKDDTATIDHASRLSLPNYFHIVIVPPSHPKTKPKACNYGLKKSNGDFVVIYDAEDAPEPSQLKKAVLSFAKESPDIACIQAKLNFYNPHQNILTRIFTAEYSLWFDLVLTGLQTIHAPIPLGGTSNHFKASVLKELKGWDSFNVTEDCDLGVRLAKKGYRTAIMDSITLEEANSSATNWFWQRTRWIKGYVQTYFVHMRNPLLFLTGSKKAHLLTFQLVVGGKVLSTLINPLLWILTVLYFLFRAHLGTFIESFFPLPVLYMGAFSFIIGNFLYMYYYMIGCVRHGHFSLVKYVFLVPIYWLAMSTAAWVAVYKFLTKPHHWFKTQHGLHFQKPNFGPEFASL